MTLRRLAPVFLAAGRWRPSQSGPAYLSWVMLASVALTLVAIGALNLIASPSTIAVIEGRTEYLQYRSFNPQLSSFSVNGFRVAYADQPNLDGVCLEGTLVPEADSIISYTKRRNEPLAATVNGGGAVLHGGMQSEFAGELGVFADPSCGTAIVDKLPVWGPGQIGDAFTVRQDGIGPVLLSGSLSVFGRTLDLGWFGAGGALYAATSQPIALPPGGWVWTDGTSATTQDAIAPEQAALFGFLSATEGSFGMSLTTETPRLQIIAPGGRMEPNRVEIGMFAQILNDPNVLRLQLFILIFFFLLPILTDLFSLALLHSERKK